MKSWGKGGGRLAGSTCPDVKNWGAYHIGPWKKKQMAGEKIYRYPEFVCNNGRKKEA